MKKRESKPSRRSKSAPSVSRPKAKKAALSRRAPLRATQAAQPNHSPLLLAGPLPRATLFFRQETGQSLPFWALIALLNFIAQIIFRRELAPGAFGTLNSALGVVGLSTVPALALHQALNHYLATTHPPDRQERINRLRAAAPLVVPDFTWISAIAFLLLLPWVLPLLGLTHFSIGLFTLLNVLIATAAMASASICQEKKQLLFWAWLLAAAALARVILGVGLTSWQPGAESALAACLLAGLILLLPVLRQDEHEPAWLKSWPALADRDFLLYLGATFSVVLALFLFSSADRIVAQGWFGTPTNNNLGFVNWPELDGYQTAGLLGRALLWGTQPLLLLFFAQRSRLAHTTLASLKFLWIYLGALLLGAILLGVLGQPLSQLFCGADFRIAAGLVPAFAVVMVPLGLLQALATFALASRRHPECFVLGACSVAYAILLYTTGRHPHVMLAYMFGTALFSLMLVLLVGIIRWSRTQP